MSLQASRSPSYPGQPARPAWWSGSAAVRLALITAAHAGALVFLAHGVTPAPAPRAASVEAVMVSLITPAVAPEPAPKPAPTPPKPKPVEPPPEPKPKPKPKPVPKPLPEKPAPIQRPVEPAPAAPQYEAAPARPVEPVREPTGPTVAGPVATPPAAPVVAPPPPTPPTITSGIQYLQPPAPQYPPVSRRMAEEGTVQLRVLVNERGRAEQAEVQASSGFERLDEAAKRAVMRALFKPHMVNGRAISVYVTVPIKFQLDS